MKGRDAARPREKGRAATAGNKRGVGSSSSGSGEDIRTIFNGRRAGNLVHQVIVEVEIVIVAKIVFVGRVDAIVGGGDGVLLVLAVGVHGSGYSGVGVLRLERRRRRRLRGGDVGLICVGETGAVSVGRTVQAGAAQELLGSLVSDFAKGLGLMGSERVDVGVVVVVLVASVRVGVSVAVAVGVCVCASVRAKLIVPRVAVILCRRGFLMLEINRVCWRRGEQGAKRLAKSWLA